jgi:hypothetical protein
VAAKTRPLEGESKEASPFDIRCSTACTRGGLAVLLL